MDNDTRVHHVDCKCHNCPCTAENHCGCYGPEGCMCQDAHEGQTCQEYMHTVPTVRTKTHVTETIVQKKNEL